ncbi:hypothetical protein [Flectobacillus roseus]|uniref:hypothetical protein n=1 Tax=Flectobacillus roseus TaxID=502259 RepID=UPI0024B810F2|nr:hypothetical protein [Flectobacillus roseus]MDI9868002.1 hypothetical protein [Flectobacillus roseus]
MTEIIIKIDDITFKIFRHSETEVQQLNEANNSGRKLVGTYTYDIHKPHNPTGEYHIHLRNNGNEILSMNKSGTAHDNYHGIRIPNKAFKELKKQLPDWTWPNNQILESLQHTYILDKNVTEYLRPVQVFKHRNYDLQEIDSFVGFFHQFAEDPFLTGGNGGWKERTIALIETEEGYIRKIPVSCFKFTDV